MGAIYKGKVTRLMTFGAFVEIAPGKEGLVHISRLDVKRVEKVEDVVAVGDQVLVKVTEIDEQGRLNLSRRDALIEVEGLKPENTVSDAPRPPAAKAAFTGTAAAVPPPELSDKPNNKRGKLLRGVCRLFYAFLSRRRGRRRRCAVCRPRTMPGSSRSSVPPASWKWPAPAPWNFAPPPQRRSDPNSRPTWRSSSPAAVFVKTASPPSVKATSRSPSL